MVRRYSQTRLKSFELEELAPERSEAMRVIAEGMLEGGDFLPEVKGD